MSQKTDRAAVSTGDEMNSRWPSRWLANPSFTSWLALAIGCVLLPFSYGVDNVACAAWLSPVFLLRFVRMHRWLVAMPVLFAVEFVGIAFQYRGMFPVTGASYLMLVVLITATTIVPYVLDRGLTHKLRGLPSTLVFPLAWTVMDYVSAFGPYGSWGAAAYSQYGEQALLQIIALTGMWSISFLIGWFAAVCNLFWEEGKSAARAVFAFAATISMVVLAGSLRIVAFPPTSPTVRVASLSARPTPTAPESLSQLIAGNASSRDLVQIQDWARTVNEDLLERADRAAQGGARIVFWSEGNASVLKQDEPALLAEGSRLAAERHIYLGMALAVWTPGAARVLENVLVMIEPSGKLAWQYNKAHAVPGNEAAMMVTSDGKLRSISTPFGRVSVAICFDADFPQTLFQAGVLNADIVLNPSSDWSGIDPWHAQMASFRAIEEGVAIIHQGSHGLSAAFDYEGNRLSAVDYFHTDNPEMISEVPTAGLRTIYSRLGDWFAWVSGAGLLALAVKAFAPDRKGLVKPELGRR